MKRSDRYLARFMCYAALCTLVWWVGPRVLPAARAPAAKAPAATPNTRPSQATPSRSKDRPEVKTRFLRALLEALDDVEDGDREDRDFVRESIERADEELNQILGGHATERILAANRPLTLPDCITEPCRPAIVVDVPSLPEGSPPAAPAEPVPSPAPPAAATPSQGELPQPQ